MKRDDIKALTARVAELDAKLAVEVENALLGQRREISHLIEQLVEARKPPAAQFLCPELLAGRWCVRGPLS
jgi:hypothetical protein